MAKTPKIKTPAPAPEEAAVDSAQTPKRGKRPNVNTVKGESMKDVGRDPVTGKAIPHEYDARVGQQIAFYIGAGMTPDEIARMLDVRPGQLKKLYGHELENGVNTTNMQVAQAMRDAAINGDVTAGKFWLKARAGWKDGESAQQTTSPLQIHIHD